MREVATFEDVRAARRFADVLCAGDVETEISPTRTGGFAVWVLDEGDLGAARAARDAFLAAPDAPEYRAAEGCLERKRRQREEELQRSRHAVIPMRERFQRQGPRGSIPATVTLIAVSVVVTLLVQSGGRGAALVEWLLIGLPGEAPFQRVLSGEVWRLVTPIFVHFGWLHIFFNAWWLADLGAAIERRLGSARLLVLVVTTGVLSNALQYVVVGSPYFGGLSGVVYALLGYVWVRGRRDPSFGLALSQQAVVILLVWLGLGFTGILGSVANFAHLGGLVAGVALAYLAR